MIPSQGKHRGLHSFNHLYLSQLHFCNTIIQGSMETHKRISHGSNCICRVVCLYHALHVHMVNLKLLSEVAKGKGLKFGYDASLGWYSLRDVLTGMLLAEYADITVELMTERAWREEFNKFRVSKYK